MSRCDSLTFIPEGGGHAGWDELNSLVVAVARGDHSAFGLVYERPSGPVYGVLAVLRDRAQAEEVAQEVFLEMWRLAFRYDPGRGSPTRWALTIARHRSIDRARSAPPPPPPAHNALCAECDNGSRRARELAWLALGSGGVGWYLGPIVSRWVKSLPGCTARKGASYGER